METTGNLSSWIQVGGQDQSLEVDYLSPTWWWEMRDKRVDPYPMMMNPFAIVLVSLAYTVFVWWLGPRFMRDREPYSLKNTLLFYNFTQVVFSIYMIQEAWDAGWGRHYSWGKYSNKMFDII